MARVRETRPNEYQDEWLLGKLDELEQRIFREVLAGYIIEEMGEELAVISPYDGIYEDWLIAQIDLANSEYDRYNNDLATFNAKFEEYGRYVSRNYHRERESVYRI